MLNQFLDNLTAEVVLNNVQIHTNSKLHFFQNFLHKT